MSEEFIEKVVTGVGEGHYKVELGDVVVVFCHDGFRCEGELVAYCQEGLIVDAGGTSIWINAEWIGAVGKVKDSGSGGHGEAAIPEAPSPGRKAKKIDRKAQMEEVMCNGAR